MFVSIATTHRPATDLGFLLHKNPARLHETPLSFGRAVMAYPRADEERCEFALALDIDPVALVRDRRATAISQYVNDRPYAASARKPARRLKSIVALIVPGPAIASIGPA